VHLVCDLLRFKLAINPTASRSGDFRGDINGLRAWAVIAVVLYHFNVPGFGGGFIGVDVFFVISGFLMARIVCKGLEGQQFSVASFYLARARRILPALMVLVIVLLVLGWILLMPKEYQTLGRHARESLLFSSNLRYLNEAGYFDTASHEKWLLHTWSLSVEWQFYMLYPLVLLALSRVFPGRQALLVAHLLGLLSSFGICQYLSIRQPDAAFFLLQSRAWEMLLGGVVYLLGHQIRLPLLARHFLEVVGGVFIIAAVLLVDDSVPWPGTAALLPTLGAALIIMTSRQHSMLTGSWVAQWLGERSYSIYLWHWPLVVLLVYFEREDSLLPVLAGLLLSLLFGHLSYRWVEGPVRIWLARKTNLRSAAWVVVCLVVIAVSAQLVRRSGFPERLPDAVAQIESERHNNNPRLEECLGEARPCVFGGEQIGALVIGDSHADAVVTAIAESLPSEQQGVYFQGKSACLMVFTAHRVSRKEEPEPCQILKDSLREQLPTLYPGKPLIVVNRTSVYAMGELPMPGVNYPGRPTVYFTKQFETPATEFLQEFHQHYVASACELSEHHPLYLVRPIPEMMSSVPQLLGRAMLLGKQVELSITRSAYEQRNAAVWAAQDEAAARCGARILNPLPYLCDENNCYGSRNGWPLYVDDDHLSEFGNRLLIPMFAQIFAEMKGGALAHE